MIEEENTKLIEYKKQVIEEMRKQGASDSFIQENMTTNAISDGIINDFPPAVLAWVLLQ